MLLNYYLAAFADFKKQPNDNLITFVCGAMFALVSYKDS